MVFRNSALALTVMLLASSSAQSMNYVTVFTRPALPSYTCMKCQAWDFGKFAVKVKLAFIAWKLGAKALNYGKSQVPACFSTKVAKYTPSWVKSLSNLFGRTCLGNKAPAVNCPKAKIESELIDQSRTIASMQREMQGLKDVLAKKGIHVENTSASAAGHDASPHRHGRTAFGDASNSQ